MAKTLLLQAGHRGAAGGALQPILIPDRYHEGQSENDDDDYNEHDDHYEASHQGALHPILIIVMHEDVDQHDVDQHDDHEDDIDGQYDDRDDNMIIAIMNMTIEVQVVE